MHDLNNPVQPLIHQPRNDATPTHALAKHPELHAAAAPGEAQALISAARASRTRPLNRLSKLLRRGEPTNAD